jgi:ubiquinone/menaquinone biosynthesis C-methylase UbiE
MSGGWKQRRFTNLVRYCLDDWLPPVLRDNRLLFQAIGYVFHGPTFDLDFKRKAYAMTEEEFEQAYELIQVKERYRPSDMTQAEMEWMTRNAVGPEVLEIGCGQGDLVLQLAQRGDLAVTATDLNPKDVDFVRDQMTKLGLKVNAQVANLEELPFPDRSFDTVLCAHTLEHVRRFEKAVAEMVRVCRNRLLVIVPCQRYYRYTIDYHLQFFPEVEHLLLRMGLPNAVCEKLTGDLCYMAEIAAAPEESRKTIK